MGLSATMVAEVYMPRSPKPFAVGSIRVRAIRGPRGERGRQEWYWRAERHATPRVTVWTGWATREAVERHVMEAALAAAEPRPTDATVRQLMRWWGHHIETERPELSAQTVTAYRHAAGRVVALLGDVQLTHLSVSLLEQARGQGLRRWSPRTVRYALARLEQAWTWGRSRGRTPDTECPVVTVDVPRRRKVTPTPGDVAALIQRTDGWQRVALTFLHATGARVGEVAALSWDDVDLDRGVVHLEGKTGPRSIPVAAELVAVLREWRDADRGRRPSRPDLVLGLEPQSATRGVQQFLAREPWSSHALRRAAVDRMARSGVDVATAAAYLGHTVETMLASYRQVSEGDLLAAVERAQLGRLPRGEVVSFPAKVQGEEEG